MKTRTSASPIEMLWLALHFPRLGLEVYRDASATEAGSDTDRELRPAVLLEDNRVVLCDTAASDAGILPGCTLATAHSICPDLNHFRRDENRELARLTFLGETLYRFSAQVSLEAPDSLVLEIGASLELFGNPQKLAAQAEALSLALGHQACWQIASTPGAALLMARAGVRQLEAVALSCVHPDRQTVKQLERLANMGLHTLGALLHLPDTELGQRFGPDLVDYLGQLTGRLPDPRKFISPSPRFDQSLHLLEPIRSKEDLLSHASAPMHRLLNELGHWLVSHQLGAEQLIWSFSPHTEANRVALPLRFARAQQSPTAFLNVTRLRLEQMELPEDILNVRLEAPRLTPWLGGSRQLFAMSGGMAHAGSSEVGSEVSSEVIELIDQLRARLGERACSAVKVHDQHAPESAWLPARPEAVTAGRAFRAGAGPSASSVPPSRSRPLWLFDPPRPTERERLTLLKGPERIQTAWWQQSIRRDYYIAALQSGARCWVFVDIHEHWYLHGYFG